jgi:hypothetical protein
MEGSRKALKGFALAMLLVLVAVPFIGAQTVTWKSSFTVVNLGRATATVTVTFYNAFYDWYSHLSIQNMASIPMSITVSFYQNTPTPIAVINNDYNQGERRGAEQSYNGLVAGALDLYCPGLYDRFATGDKDRPIVWISSLNVQNLGATTATVNIWYSDGLSDTLVIAPNAASLTVYMDGEHAPPPEGKRFFSAHVESTNGVVIFATRYADYLPGSSQPPSPPGGGWSGSARVYSTGNDLVGIVNQNNENLDAGEGGDFALSFLMFGQ